MALGAGMSCVKYLLFFFNLLFALAGLVFLVLGVMGEINAHPLVNLTDASFYTTLPMLVIIAGILIFVVAFFGCCGAVKENHCMIVTYSMLLLVILVAELAICIAVVVKRVDLDQSVIKSLNKSIDQYSVDPLIKKSFDLAQNQFQCCGVEGPGDWAAHGLAVPDSCCSGLELVRGVPAQCTPQSPGFFTQGCYRAVVDSLHVSVWVAGLGIAIACAQLLGVIFACCVARSIRSQYETV